jgi:hypothetical protein
MTDECNMDDINVDIQIISSLKKCNSRPNNRKHRTVIYVKLSTTTKSDHSRLTP